jgi:23S rRNA (guanosine2251-2'-O)-methyltransferase
MQDSRMTTSTEMLYALHPVTECLKAGRRRVLEIFVSRKHDERVGVVLKLAAAGNVPVQRISRSDIQRLAMTGEHQGICARVEPYPLADFTQLLTVAGSQLLLLLDQIVDVQNFGSLVRTALCAGAGGVVIPLRRAAQPGPAVSKASAGALEPLPVARVAPMPAAIKQLKNSGFWIVGLGGRAGRSLFEVDLTGPLALVIGGEQKGIRPLVRRHCDFLAAIHQQGPLDSLNASAAGAVALFEALRQRRAGKVTG